MWDIHIHTYIHTHKHTHTHTHTHTYIWDMQKKKCKIIDICVPLDVNVASQEKTKVDTYAPLIVGLLRIYPTYNFEVIVTYCRGSNGTGNGLWSKTLRRPSMMKKKRK